MTLTTTDRLRVEYNGDGFWMVWCSKPGYMPWQNPWGWARLTRWELERCLRKARPDLAEEAILDISHDETGSKYSFALD